MEKNSLNRVILIGHLGGNPEGRYTQQGRATASLTLATNESWTSKEGKTSDMRPATPVPEKPTEQWKHTSVNTCPTRQHRAAAAATTTKWEATVRASRR